MKTFRTYKVTIEVPDHVKPRDLRAAVNGQPINETLRDSARDALKDMPALAEAEVHVGWEPGV